MNIFHCCNDRGAARLFACCVPACVATRKDRRSGCRPSDDARRPVRPAPGKPESPRLATKSFRFGMNHFQGVAAKPPQGLIAHGKTDLVEQSGHDSQLANGQTCRFRWCRFFGSSEQRGRRGLDVVSILGRLPRVPTGPVRDSRRFRMGNTYVDSKRIDGRRGPPSMGERGARTQCGGRRRT